MQSTGLISFAAVMWAAGRWPLFEAGMLPYALALGLTGVIAVAALYRGLALGPVAVVAPVVASRSIDLRVFRARVALALGTTVGILDTLANGLFARGIESGYASLAATGTGMYPIVPAVLGMIALGERLAPNQIVGIIVLVIGLATLGAVS